MKKKFMAVILALAAALALTACGAPGGSGTVKNKKIKLFANFSGDPLEFRYSGEWADGKPNGHGQAVRFTDILNEIFVGDFVNGSPSGDGYVLWYDLDDSDYYYSKLTFVDGKISGSDCYSEFRFKDYISYQIGAREESGFDETAQYYKLEGGVITDEHTGEAITGKAVESIKKQMEDHFGYTDKFNELCELIGFSADYNIVVNDSSTDDNSGSGDSNSGDSSNSSSEPTLVRGQDIGGGRIYSGYMVNGVPDGSGELRWHTDDGWGGAMIGSFKNGKLSGYGRSMEVNGINYIFCQGTFADDKLSGEGYMEYCLVDGGGETECFIGTFSDGYLSDGEYWRQSSYGVVINVGSFYPDSYSLLDGYEADFGNDGTVYSCIRVTGGEKKELPTTATIMIGKLKNIDAAYISKAVSTHHDYNDSFNEMKIAAGVR